MKHERFRDFCKCILSLISHFDLFLDNTQVVFYILKLPSINIKSKYKGDVIKYDIKEGVFLMKREGDGVSSQHASNIFIHR